MAWVKTGSAAVVSLAVLGVLCFALQALALGRPGAAEIELVHTLSVLRIHSSAGTLRASELDAGSICTSAERSDRACPRAIVRWFGRELSRGAKIVRQPVDLGGVHGFVLRVRASTPPLELVVARSGAPVGLALAVPNNRGEVLR
jgi:hypothetical protein